MIERRKLGHDMRNSMNALQLHAQVLRLCEGADLIESLDAIIHAADRLVQMLDELDAIPADAPIDPDA